MRTIPYSHLSEKIDSVIAQLIDDTEGELSVSEELDVITDNEVEYIKNFIEVLEEIRGEIND